MTKSKRPKFSSEQGSSLLIVLVLAMLVSIGSAVLLFLREENLRATYMGQRSAITLSLAKSGVDSFMLAWKNIESEYFKTLVGCDSANGLIAAMGSGTGCPGRSANVLTPATFDPLAGPTTYNFRSSATGCQISPSSSNCTSYTGTFLEMGVTNPDQTRELGRYKFEFQLLHVLPASHLAEFRLFLTSPEGVVTRYDFVFQDVAQSLVHLESSGRVVQEKGDPFTLCPVGPWEGFRAFNLPTQSCLDFDEAGSGTGLVSYKGRLFGLRPETGQIVDLLALSSGGSPTSYLVQPNGTITGLGQVFVPYPAPTNLNFSLVNADDISLIDNQIYYVRGNAVDTQLRMLVNNGGAWTDTLICNIGASGWAQSIAGLASMSWNDPIGRESGDPVSDAMTRRTATFFAKTDSGDMLSIRVASPSAGTYDCTIFKDLSLQQVEYKRTLGFEGASTQSKYFIY